MRIPFAGAALAAAASVPYLLAAHTLPQSTFYAEWIAALLWLVATLSLTGEQDQASQDATVSPLPLQLWVAAALAAGVALALGVLARTSWPPLYLVGGALVAASGHRAAQRYGSEQIVIWFAAGILVAAVAGTGIELLQLLRIDRQLGGWISVVGGSAGRRLFGDLNQPNHQATLVSLGLAAAVYFASRSRSMLAWLAWVAAIVWLELGIVMTGSRTGLIQIGLVALTGLLIAVENRHGTAKRSLLVALLLVPMLLALQGGLGTADRAFGFGLDNAVGRMQAGGDGHWRMAMWRHAWQMFVDHPWFGVGWSGFGWAQFTQLDRLGIPVEVANNAHNLVLDQLAKTGLVGVAWTVWSLGGWLVRVLRAAFAQRRLAVRALPLCWVALVLLHSMVEYPLHYAYFWLPFCFWLGLADPGRAPRWRLSAPFAARLALASSAWALGLLVFAAADYRLAEALYYGNPQQQYEQAPPRWLFWIDATYGYAGTMPLNADDLPRKLALHEAAAHLSAQPLMIRRLALLTALDGRDDDAFALLRPLHWYYLDTPDADAKVLRDACAALPAAQRPPRFCAAIGQWSNTTPLPQ